MLKSLLLSLSLFSVLFASASNPIKKTYTTTMLSEDAPIIDGIIDDVSWDIVPWAGDFTVQRPNNGDTPKRQTKFKIVYDAEHIYVAARCFHEDPSKIDTRLARRDNFPGDWVEINIDSYYDKSTAFSFTLSASGVKGDEFVTGNGANWDANWNPIWFGKANIDDEGWTAEFKIPLSQLRFGNKVDHTWGFNIMRRDFGADERSTYQWIPTNVTGWVSNYAELKGISGIKPKRQLEIQPFVVTGLKTGTPEVGNPYESKVSSVFNMGIDGKVGVTSDITLDFTINPDFGQVEADPSQISLNGFQIFFQEKRPFFIENANLFGFQVSNLAAGGQFGNDNLFYSRRIGAAPSGKIDQFNYDYQKTPELTSILGAAKVSGKTKKGWSINILESITAQERATLNFEGKETTTVVEPLSNYFVGGMAKDINKGSSSIAFKLTAVNRQLKDTNLEDQFHDQAMSGGLSLFHSWKNREWQMTGNFIFSNIHGSETKILNTQHSFEHYFQRPDASHLKLDPAKTTLLGHGGTVSIGNFGGSDNLSFQTGLTWRSPELELNDIGFLNTADQIDHVTWIGYRFPKSFSIFRQLGLNANHYNRWTFGGEHLYHGIQSNIQSSLSNYWSISLSSNVDIKDVSQKALFGGPLMRQSAGAGYSININSDNRKKVRFGVNYFAFEPFKNDKGAIDIKSYSFWVRYQPSNNFDFMVSPRYFIQQRAIQNVDQAVMNGMTRYITGHLDQKTYSLSLRANYNILPNLTIQYWGQPFIANANYSAFKYITDPLAKVNSDRYHLYNSEEIKFNSEDETYSIDENQDGVVDYNFSIPDFKFLQFRSNFVIRWEYRPGSELFLVWTQSNSNLGDPMQDVLPSIKEDLFGEAGNHIFLVKATYRFF